MWQRMKIRLRPHALLFGLYEGIPKTRRGNNYSLVLPDKITIFKRPLEAVARDEAHLVELVKNTVWHEVAHHFGLSDEEIHRRERKG
jgi:predicted Zn-dependent protease with MMP-like domain